MSDTQNTESTSPASVVEERLQNLEVQASRWRGEAMRWRILLLALLIFGGIIAACGTDDDNSDNNDGGSARVVSEDEVRTKSLVILKADGSAAGTLTADADGYLRFTNADGSQTVVSIQADADGNALVLHDADSDGVAGFVAATNTMSGVPAGTNAMAVFDSADNPAILAGTSSEGNLLSVLDTDGNAAVSLVSATDAMSGMPAGANGLIAANGVDSEGNAIIGAQIFSTDVGHLLSLGEGAGGVELAALDAVNYVSILDDEGNQAIDINLSALNDGPVITLNAAVDSSGNAIPGVELSASSEVNALFVGDSTGACAVGVGYDGSEDTGGDTEDGCAVAIGSTTVGNLIGVADPDGDIVVTLASTADGNLIGVADSDGDSAVSILSAATGNAVFAYDGSDGTVADSLIWTP